MIPATPAAAWVWPMLDLTEPSHSGRSSGAVLAVGGEQGLGLDRVAEGGAGAVGLDRVDVGGVQAGRWPAPARMTRCWEGPLGAVSPLEAPSWLTAEPRMTARTGWPLRCGVGQPLQQDQCRRPRPSRCRRRRRRTACSGRRRPGRAGG